MNNSEEQKPKKPGDWTMVIKKRDEKETKKQKIELSKKSKAEK